MVDEPLLRDLAFIVLAGTTFVLLARVAKVPSIVGYIAAGLVLGPVLGLVEVTEWVHLIAEVGIALLLFLVGLELSLDKIRDVGRVAVYAGIGQVIFTAAGGMAVCLLLGFDWLASLFIATALTFSSTVVVVKLLDQKDELDSVYGRIAVGIFLVQDIVVVVALTFLSGIGRDDAMELGDAAVNLGIAFGGMALILVVAALAARFALPRLFGWIAGRENALFIWALCWCFLLVMGAEAMEISLEIGAFLAGISLAQLPYNDELRRRVHPLMNFFIAVFFVSLGIQMEFGAAAEYWVPAVLLSLFVLLGNPLIFMLIISRMGYTERTSFLTSVTVAQISEFSFILAALGLATGVIDEGILSLIGVVGLVTIATSSYMILYNHSFYRLVKRLRLLAPFRAREGSEEEPREEWRDHVIVVGMNTLGRRIAVELHERGETVLAVDTDPGKLRDLPGPTMIGNVNYMAVLEEAGLHHARLLVSALRIEDTNRLLAYRAQRAGVPAAIHALDREMVSELRRIGVDHLLNSRRAGVEQTAEVLREEGVYQP